MTCQTITITKIKLCAGDLKHKVTFAKIEQNPRRSLNQGLEASVDMTTAFTVYAAFKPIKGVVFQEGLSMDANAPTDQVYIRYRADLDKSYRMLFQEKIYNIIDIQDPDKERKYLLLTLNERPSTTYQNNII